MFANGLDFKLREDLDRLRKIRCHRGLRHYWGVRVRGQHTKTTGRRGKTVGVVRIPRPSRPSVAPSLPDSQPSDHSMRTTGQDEGRLIDQRCRNLFSFCTLPYIHMPLPPQGGRDKPASKRSGARG